MRLALLLFICTILCSIAFPQVATKIAIVKENNYELVDAENQTGMMYVSLNALAKTITIPIKENDNGNTISLLFNTNSIKFKVNNPFVNIINANDSITHTIQLSGLPYRKGPELFVSSSSVIDLINLYWEKELIQLGSNRIKVVDRIKQTELISNTIINILSLTVESNIDYSIVRIKTDTKLDNFYSFYRSTELNLVLWDAFTKNDSIIYPSTDNFIEKIEIEKSIDFSLLKFSLKEDETIAESYKGKNENELVIRISRREFGDWLTRESEHFKIVYRDSHSHLVSHLLASAENSLNLLMRIFDYTPKKKIIINTYDASDFGFGATTTVPENYIRLEIEPLEPGYEVVPYSERFQWLLSHELVHIVVNDMAGNFESSIRTIFGKVSPDKNQPLTVFYSLLTNHNRFTPRWYQEAIAVLIETWSSGGYGRILGNFDEMFFRTLVNENKTFPSPTEIDNYTSHTSIFLENTFYMYGERFITYLITKYGVDKLITWFSIRPDEYYPGLESKFEEVYDISFDTAWDDFILNEIEFQRKNISTINRSPLTKLNRLSENSLGWVSKLTYDTKNNSILFGNDNTGKLAEIQRLNLNYNTFEEIITLPTPSLIQVTSLAYDENYKQMFYTTNNNQLYRDIWMYDFNTEKQKLLFENARVGYLTASPNTHQIWGIQHLSGKAILTRSKYPYTEMQSLTVFNVGDEFQDLSINHKGNLLAATLHRSNGQQSIVLSDISGLEDGKQFFYKTITSSGSPENPSWSADDKFLYWNAYTNGVSNIFRYNLDTQEITPLTNTVQGLFRPVQISEDSIFAMEFTSEGFIPVKFWISKAENLPAINYFGQKILEKSPEVLKWNLKPSNEVIDKSDFTAEKSYSAINNLSIQTFIPTISGFQSRLVLGIYSQINDPLLIHDLIFETGVSPFKETTKDIKFHLRLKYSYKQKLIFAFEKNAPDFFDLFNKRKRGMLGSRFAIGYNHYWVYDNPLKVKQNTEISFYNGIKFINDNLTEVREPDYAILKSDLDIQNLRKSIGSIDWESGDQIKLSIMGYGSNPASPTFSGQLLAEWHKLFLFLVDHNVLHLKGCVGYHFVNDELPETMFYFGGFGNREIENEPVKQFEKMFRFPGVPIYSIVSDKFVKLMIENSFPPIRFPGASLFGIDLKNINISIFSQGLYSDSPTIDKTIDFGGQINIMFQHWFNLESTVSTGFAKAWWSNGNDTEWFVSWKLLRD